MQAFVIINNAETLFFFFFLLSYDGGDGTQGLTHAGLVFLLLPTDRHPQPGLNIFKSISFGFFCVYSKTN